MKKIITFVLLFIMIFSMCTSIYATDTTDITDATVGIQPVSTDEKLQVKAKVIEAGKSYEKEEAEGIKRTLQDVTIEIKEGKFKGQKLDTIYVLTYDVENKIVGYELSKGNTVVVQLSVNGDTIGQATIQEVVRQNYVLIMILIFFAVILVIGRKQGIKAILGLIVTILAIYFIMINGIYNGGNAIWLSIATSVVIIVLTFIIIAGLNKKSLTAALRNIWRSNISWTYGTYIWIFC